MRRDSRLRINPEENTMRKLARAALASTSKPTVSLHKTAMGKVL
jgi:hypothetical protein